MFKNLTKTYINEEKRTIVCKITTKSDFIYPYKTFIGKSKCDPEDEFNIEKGKKLAKLRAILKYDKDNLKNIRIEKTEYEKVLKQLIKKELELIDLIEKTKNKINILVNEN